MLCGLASVDGGAHASICIIGHGIHGWSLERAGGWDDVGKSNNVDLPTV